MGIFFRSQVEVDVINRHHIEVFEHEAQAKLREIKNNIVGSKGIFTVHDVYSQGDAKDCIKMSLPYWIAQNNNVAINKEDYTNVYRCGYCQGKIMCSGKVEIWFVDIFRTPPNGVRNLRRKLNSETLCVLLESEMVCKKCGYKWQ